MAGAMAALLDGETPRPGVMDAAVIPGELKGQRTSLPIEAQEPDPAGPVCDLEKALDERSLLRKCRTSNVPHRLKNSSRLRMLRFVAARTFSACSPKATSRAGNLSPSI